MHSLFFMMYNLRNKRVNRHCTTITSCRAQDLGRGSCVLNELQSPSTSDGSSVMSSMATATTPTPIEAPNSNATQPAVDVSEETQVTIPQTTKAGKPRKRMKWTQDMNSFIMRSYYKITKFETDLTTYRTALHSAFIEKFPDLRNVTEQRIADQRRVIVRNNLLPTPILNRIKEEVQLELQNQCADPPADAQVGNLEERLNEEITGDDQPTELEENNHVHTSRDNKMETARYELQRALTEFYGTCPTQRPKLPKLKTNRETHDILKAFNIILLDTIGEYTSIEKLHTLIYCSAAAVLRCHKQQVHLQQKAPKITKPQKPIWQKRLEKTIEDVRQELGRITEFQRSEHPSRRLKTRIKKIFKKIGTKITEPNHQETVAEYIDTLKQTLKAKSKRLRRYTKCSKRKQQNDLFNTNQRQFYRELQKNASLGNDYNKTPSREHLTEYWSNIWAMPKEHNRNATWIQTQRRQINATEMEFDLITREEVSRVIKDTNNWKAPGVDNIHNFWYKQFHVLHEHLAHQFTEIMHHPEKTPAFLMLGSTTMLPKSSRTEDPSQYRPITCLPAMYKILTGCISNKIYQHLQSNNILAEEQKGCIKEHRGCKEQLIIDSVILKQAREKRRNLHTAFIDYKKAFDSVPHSWLLDVLEMYKIHPTIVNFLATIKQQWRTNLKLFTKDQSLTTDEISIKRGIFQGDSLSPLWFCLAMNPLSTLLNSTQNGFSIKANRENYHVVSHLMYMDDIKLYSANDRQIKNLIDVAYTFSTDICMDFGMEKCKVLHIEKGKIINGDVALPNGDIFQAMDDGETYKYLGFQQAKLLEDKQGKIKIKNNYFQRVKALLKTELNARNLITAINSYAVPVLTYSFGILKWTNTELEELQRTTRTMMTKHKMHHPRASTLRLTLPRREGGRSMTDLVNLHSKQVMKLREFFNEKAQTSSLHQITLLSDHSYTPLNMRNPNIIFRSLPDAEKKDQWAQMALHGRHYNDLNQPHVDTDASNRWLKDGVLFPETEGFVMAIQDQVINTRNYSKFIIKDRSIESDKCRKCHDRSETIQHITSGCTYLANTDYLHRHNQVCNIIHQKLANKCGLLNTYQPYYKYQPNSVLENDSFKLYYDRAIITDRRVTNNRPDVVLLNKGMKTAYLIDVAIPNNNNMLDKYQEKKTKYAELAIEVQQMWQLDKVHVVPIIVSSTGLIPKTLENNLKVLGLHYNTFIDIQKAVLLGTCHLVRKFLQDNV